MMKEYRSNASSKALFVLGGILVFICTFIFMTNLMKPPVYGNSVPRASHSYSVSAVTESENLSDTLKGGNIK